MGRLPDRVRAPGRRGARLVGEHAREALPGHRSHPRRSRLPRLDPQAWTHAANAASEDEVLPTTPRRRRDARPHGDLAMSAFEDRLNQALPRLVSADVLENKGAGGEIGFWIFDYPPEREMEMR